MCDDFGGSSLLEFQACGCPVISTDVRALPEINDNETGWRISVPKNKLGEAIYTTHEDRLKVSAAIKAGLADALHEIFRNSRVIIPRSSATAGSNSRSAQ
jgi:glycosyltransferase involved in cell wall biosynthesis